MIQMVSPYAYCIQLPRSVKIHPVRSITERDLAPSDPVPGHVISPPPAVVIDGHEEHQVNALLYPRIFRTEAQHSVQ